MGHHRRNIGFFADITADVLKASGVGRVDGADFREGGLKGGKGYICHENGGAFAEEEDGCFKANTA